MCLTQTTIRVIFLIIELISTYMKQHKDIELGFRHCAHPVYFKGWEEEGPGREVDGTKSFLPAQPFYTLARFNRTCCKTKIKDKKLHLLLMLWWKGRQSRSKRRYWVHNIFNGRPIVGEFYHFIEKFLMMKENICHTVA